MKLKKTLFVAFIASTFAYSSVALAAPTPEFSLLEKVIAVSGQNLSAQEVQADVGAAMNEYLATASSEGQLDRMKDALIEMGVYTPDQAAAFVADAQAAAARVSKNATTVDGASRALAAQFATLAGLHPMGAEYSNCDGVDTGATIFGLGAATAVVGAIFYYNDNSWNNDNQEFGRQLMTWGGVAAGVGVIVMIATSPSCH